MKFFKDLTEDQKLIYKGIMWQFTEHKSWTITDFLVVLGVIINTLKRKNVTKRIPNKTNN